MDNSSHAPPSPAVRLRTGQRWLPQRSGRQPVGGVQQHTMAQGTVPPPPATPPYPPANAPPSRPPSAIPERVSDEGELRNTEIRRQ